MKMLRILEVSWLIIAILSVVFGTYKCISSGINEAVFIYGIGTVATVFYIIRRKQRNSAEKHNKLN